MSVNGMMQFSKLTGLVDRGRQHFAWWWSISSLQSTLGVEKVTVAKSSSDMMLVFQETCPGLAAKSSGLQLLGQYQSQQKTALTVLSV